VEEEGETSLLVPDITMAAMRKEGGEELRFVVVLGYVAADRRPAWWVGSDCGNDGM